MEFFGFLFPSGNDDDLPHGIRGLNISSGNRTYRKPSPTRPSISRNSFQPHTSLRESASPPSSTPDVGFDAENGEKGFYISFDNDAPKKPKPALGTKRNSPKKVSRIFELYDIHYRNYYFDFDFALKCNIRGGRNDYTWTFLLLMWIWLHLGSFFMRSCIWNVKTKILGTILLFWRKNDKFCDSIWVWN